MKESVLQIKFVPKKIAKKQKISLFINSSVLPTILYLIVNKRNDVKNIKESL